MNKRQKIVISITGITLVLLILVGLTYAYFLTRIQGNTNTKSISVTTADLRIVYADGNANVITKEKIIPGTVIGEKDFTVTNEGNSEADYIVVIDDVVINNVTSSDTTTFNSNDFVYTLTCVSKNKNTNEVSGTCDGVSSETTLPLTNNSLLVANKIAENIRHEYVLTVTYKETGIDQSEDMNKKLEAKVDIKDIKSINPYSSNTSSLAYNIINNAMLNKNGTELRAKPLTNIVNAIQSNVTDRNENVKISTFLNSDDQLYIGDTEETDEMMGTPVSNNSCTQSSIGKYIYATVADMSMTKLSASEIVDCSDGDYVISRKIVENEKELSILSDDYGSSYYYRGGVEDNYINFAGMCWRIMRIHGNGAIKIILENKDGVCSSGMDRKWYIGGINSGSINESFVNNYAASDVANSFKSFQTATLSNKISTTYSNTIDKYLNPGDWCLDKEIYQTNEYGLDSSFNTTNDKSLAENGWYTEYYYMPYKRIDIDKSLSLKCGSQKINKFSDDTNMYVATLTADEALIAGAKSNYSYINSSNNFTPYYITLSPKNNEPEMGWVRIYYYGATSETTQNDYQEYYYRPVVTLLPGLEISSGDGTINNPYNLKQLN